MVGSIGNEGIITEVSCPGANLAIADCDREM